uniref:Zonadhesin-like protein n=1 Tax=Clandestinovirus TaxID=2831644 RepID=A0A8F8KLJ3_9VIRU|nr:zonadhesin-like protein [Clandestinovirus]
MSQIANSSLIPRSPVLDIQSPNPQVTAEGCRMFKENLLDKLQESMFVRFQELWYQCECVLFHDNESGTKKYQNQDVCDIFRSLISSIEHWPDPYKNKEFEFVKIQVPKLGEWLLKIVLFQAHILATTQTTRTAKEIDVEKPDEKIFVEKMYKTIAHEILVSLQTKQLYVFSIVQGDSIEAEKRKRVAMPIIRKAIEQSIDLVARMDKIIEEQMFDNDNQNQEEQASSQRAMTPAPSSEKVATPKIATPAPKTPAPKTPMPKTPATKTPVPKTPSSKKVSSSEEFTGLGTPMPKTPRSNAVNRSIKTPTSSASRNEGTASVDSSASHTPTPSTQTPAKRATTVSGTPRPSSFASMSATPRDVSTPSSTPGTEFKKPVAPYRKSDYTPLTTPRSKPKKSRSDKHDEEEIFVSASQTKYLKSPPF